MILDELLLTSHRHKEFIWLDKEFFESTLLSYLIPPVHHVNRHCQIHVFLRDVNSCWSVLKSDSARTEQPLASDLSNDLGVSWYVDINGQTSLNHHILERICEEIWRMVLYQGQGLMSVYEEFFCVYLIKFMWLLFLNLNSLEALTQVDIRLLSRSCKTWW